MLLQTSHLVTNKVRFLSLENSLASDKNISQENFVIRSENFKLEMSVSFSRFSQCCGHKLENCHRKSQTRNFVSNQPETAESENLFQYVIFH